MSTFVPIPPENHRYSTETPIFGTIVQEREMMTDDKIAALIAEAREFGMTSVLNEPVTALKVMYHLAEALEALTANTETTVEWGVRLSSGTVMHRSEKLARRLANDPMMKLVSRTRTVTPWKEEST